MSSSSRARSLSSKSVRTQVRGIDARLLQNLAPVPRAGANSALDLDGGVREVP